MKKTFNDHVIKLVLIVLLSSFTLLPARAHEVLPTIADITVRQGAVDLQLRANIEALLSGIDLDDVGHTENAENSEVYDRLRALSDEDVAARATDLLSRWNALPLLRADGQPVQLEMTSVEVSEDVDVDLPRISQMKLRAVLPDSAPGVVLAWPAGAGPLVLRQQGVAEPYTGYLEGGSESPEIGVSGGGQQSGWQAFVGYIPVGFDHILPNGLDHILFVLGLFFLSAHLRPLILQVSAFTAAHTVTLALGALGWVSVPASIVEPLIAASIVYVAVENIFTSGLSRWRPLVIFGFGLLHGLGFASVLGAFGLPERQFIPALLGFNIGVEIGQLTVIAIMFLCVAQALRVLRGEGRAQGTKVLYVGLTVLALALCVVPLPNLGTLLQAPVPVFLIPLALIFTACFLSVQFRQTSQPYRRFVAVPASVGIAAIGAYWFMERVFL